MADKDLKRKKKKTLTDDGTPTPKDEDRRAKSRLNAPTRSSNEPLKSMYLDALLEGTSPKSTDLTGSPSSPNTPPTGGSKPSSTPPTAGSKPSSTLPTVSPTAASPAAKESPKSTTPTESPKAASPAAVESPKTTAPSPTESPKGASPAQVESPKNKAPAAVESPKTTAPKEGPKSVHVALNAAPKSVRVDDKPTKSIVSIPDAKQKPKEKPKNTSAYMDEVLQPPKVETLTVTFDYEPGDTLGLEVTERLKVVNVDKRPGHSPLWGKLKAYDKILQVNKKKVQTKDELVQSLPRTSSTVKLIVERYIRVSELTPLRRAYHQTDKLYPLDACLTVFLLQSKNGRLGLKFGITKSLLVVMGVVEDSPSSGVLEAGDIILDIHGVKCDNAEKAKKALSSAMKQYKMISLAVVRPLTVETLKKAQPNIDESEEKTKADAMLIGRAEALNRRLKEPKVGKGILVKRSAKTKNRATVNTSPNVLDVHTDTEKEEIPNLHSVKEMNDDTRMPKQKNKTELLNEKIFAEY
ncbi:unnamed protein product [Bursaphelenchus okinawaensis]|uniref:PDZ domain-containing protein n=1 Tax=Bursaphelenchus okinawaensis TaxID=465554 RepID=A0A811LCQ7_9BILA|nr:unnamed protein product [Bursaphelenchus okinawaensis]CAG9121508.1 unnamed protein product [Bursaphelenchus okinawaensis]